MNNNGRVQEAEFRVQNLRTMRRPGFLIYAAALILAGALSARADVSDPGNMTLGQNAVIGGTATVQGNAFSVGGSTLVVANGNVGIGTASPAHALDVYSGANGEMYFQNSSQNNLHVLGTNAMFVADSNNGTAGGLFIENSGSAKGEFTQVSSTMLSAGTIAANYYFRLVSGNNHDTMDLDPNGNVGIGTTSPAGLFEVGGGTLTALSNGMIGIGTTSPGFPFDEESLLGNTTAKFGQDPGAIYFIENDPIIGFNTYYNSGFKIGGTGYAAYVDESPNNGNFSVNMTSYSATSGNTPNFTNRLTITPAGNIGIGTASPAAPLTIQYNNIPGLLLTGTSGNATGIEIVNSNYSSGNAWYIANDSLGGLTFDQNLTDKVWFGRSGSNNIIFNSGGNVGIGTTNAQATLTVGNYLTGSAASPFFTAYGGSLQPIIGSPSPIASFGFSSSNSTMLAIRAYRDSLGSDWTTAGIDLSMDVDNTPYAGAFIELDHSGKVGVGINNPQYSLDVNGQAHASSFPTSSDARLKTNLTPIANALAKVQALKGYDFNWNKTYVQERFSDRISSVRTGEFSVWDSTFSVFVSSSHLLPAWLYRRETGVLAQDVEAQLPNLVTTWGPDHMRAVEYGRLTAVLIEAVKEEQKEINILKAEIAALQTQKK